MRYVRTHWQYTTDIAPVWRRGSRDILILAVEPSKWEYAITPRGGRSHAVRHSAGRTSAWPRAEQTPADGACMVQWTFLLSACRPARLLPKASAALLPRPAARAL